MKFADLIQYLEKIHENAHFLYNDIRDRDLTPAIEILEVSNLLLSYYRKAENTYMDEGLISIKIHEVVKRRLESYGVFTDTDLMQEVEKAFVELEQEND